MSYLPLLFKFLTGGVSHHIGTGGAAARALVRLAGESALEPIAEAIRRRAIEHHDSTQELTQLQALCRACIAASPARAEPVIMAILDETPPSAFWARRMRSVAHAVLASPQGH
jgi:hypothetical protein